MIATCARAEEGGQEYPILSDAGASISNFRIPPELDPSTLPGIIWKGSKDADVVLYEFFDYNCAFCKKAAREIETLGMKDAGLRIGLVNNAILSIGSIQAAKVQQAVLKLRGPRAANDFHLRMFGKRGQSDGASALGVAKELGLDAHNVEEVADSPIVAEVLSRQAQLATSLGMSMTPSFVIAGVGILGWPGANTLGSIISSVRKCDRPVCNDRG